MQELMGEHFSRNSEDERINELARLLGPFRRTNEEKSNGCVKGTLINYSDMKLHPLTVLSFSAFLFHS